MSGGSLTGQLLPLLEGRTDSGAFIPLCHLLTITATVLGAFNKHSQSSYKVLNAGVIKTGTGLQRLDLRSHGGKCNSVTRVGTAVCRTKWHKGRSCHISWS